MPILGSTEDLALCGWDDAPADGPVFALGDAKAEAGAADIRFAGRGDGRLIAPADSGGLWRLAPWPVRDALFDLPPAADPSAVLIVAPEPVTIADALRDDGANVTTAARLTLDALEAAGVVVLLEDSALFPRLAPCVLAARRVLITDGSGATFGLQPGIEFLNAPAPREAVERANLARLHPQATASLRVMGARAAKEHRASLIYPRLTADLGAAAA
jgi:hypothetical protein